MSASLAALAAADFAVAFADRAFARAAEATTVQVGPPDAARQFPALAALQRAFALATPTEGRVIEKSVETALAKSPHFHVLGKRKVVVTEGDRALAARNAYNALAAIEPPAATDPIGAAEIDCVAVDLRVGALLLLDTKRAPAEGDANASGFVEGCLGAQRSLRRLGVRFAELRPLRIRWFLSQERAPAGFVGREAVDGALKAPVREVVDFAVAAYRARFAERLKAVLSETSAPPPVAVRDEAERATPVFAFDLAALNQAFNAGPRFTRRS